MRPRVIASTGNLDWIKIADFPQPAADGLAPLHLCVEMGVARWVAPGEHLPGIPAANAVPNPSAGHGRQRIGLRSGRARTGKGRPKTRVGRGHPLVQARAAFQRGATAATPKNRISARLTRARPTRGFHGLAGRHRTKSIVR
jgi:hypothetical protein